MKILIDGDACPVIDIAVQVVAGAGLECLILCDTSHMIERNGASTITVSKGPDSVDFKLANLAQPGDIAITQDYGLAAMCLARRARVINHDGIEYTRDNIDALLSARHEARRIRAAGGRAGRIPKRSRAQDDAFRGALQKLTGSNG